MKTFLIGCVALFIVEMGPTPYIHVYAQDAEVAVVADPAPMVAPAVEASAEPGVATHAVGDDGVAVTVSKDADSKVPTVPIEDVGEFIVLFQDIVMAFKDKDYRLASGLMMSLLVWGFVFIVRKFKPDLFASELGKKAVPWVSVALSVIIGVAASLVAGLAWWQIILSGVSVGLIAIGGWEALFKHVLPKTSTGEKPGKTVPVKSDG